MSELDTNKALAQHSFTKGFSEAHRNKLAEGVQRIQVAPREYLFREGEAAHAFYLIQSGHVEIGTHLAERGASVVQRVGPGDAVGWSWLLPPFHWEFDARSVEAVDALTINADWLREQCEKDHELGYHVLKQLLVVLSRRLAGLRMQRMDIYR